MTLIEYDAAFRGYRMANGLEKPPGGMTRARLEELKRLYPPPQASTPPA